MMGDYTEHLISMAGGDGGERSGMSGMAEVLHGLRVPYGGRENGYIHIDANAAHAIAAALTAAGFGPVKEAAAVALREAADDMDEVIAHGDIAEVAAPVEGSVGRPEAISARDSLYEEPSHWLRGYADAVEDEADRAAAVRGES